MQILKSLLEVDGKVSQVRVRSHSDASLIHTVLMSCSCDGFQLGGYCYHVPVAHQILREDVIAGKARTRHRLTFNT